MDEFKTAAAEEFPDAVPVMDPSLVVRLAGTLWTGVGNGSSRTRSGSGVAPMTRSTRPVGHCTPASTFAAQLSGSAT